MFQVVFCLIAIGYILYSTFFRKSKDIPKSIPGPPKLPIVGNLLQITPKNGITEMERWAFKYGPIYQMDLMGPTIVISDLNEIQTILKQRPGRFRRDDTVSKLLNGLGFRGLFTLEGLEWKESRNLIAPVLSTSKVAGMKTCVLEHVFELRNAFYEVAKVQQLQINEWFNSKGNRYCPDELISLQAPIQHTILNIVLETTLSYGQKTLFDENMFQDINGMFENINELFYFPIRSLIGFKNADDRKAIGTAKAISGKVQEVITAWKNSQNKEKTGPTNEDDADDKLKRTLLHGILESGSHLSEEVIIGNIGQVMIAGYETTAVTLSWCLYYLAKYPTAQKKIQEEADKVLGDTAGKRAKECQHLDLDKFPYAHCFLKEVLRHRPVAPIVGLTTNEKTTLLGHTIPKDVDIVLMTRLASIFGTPTKNPFEFCPERWELEESSEEYRLQSNAILAFGAGPRICPGRHLAMLEMVFIISCVFSYFDISFFPSPPGHDEVQEMSSFTMKPDNLHILLKTRRPN